MRPFSVARHHGHVPLLLGLALLAGVAAPAWGRVSRLLAPLGTLSSPTYTVAGLQRVVARDPADWVGRTVWVQGQAVADHVWVAPDSLLTSIALVDPARSDDAAPLYLQWGSADPLLAFLRNIPLVGRFAPQPQHLHWGRPVIYRLQLSRSPDKLTASDGAVLLDADPGE